MFKWWFWLLVVDFFVLMWAGAMPAEGIYSTISLIGSAYWFGYFLVILPALGVIEKPLPQPATIEEDFKASLKKKSGGGNGPARTGPGRVTDGNWRDRMFKKLAASALTAAMLTTSPALAAGEGGKIIDYDFSFEGPFGTYDRNQLQRGLQVFTEVCSSCHGLEKVAFRTLSDPNGPELPEDQMRAYADTYEIWDPEQRDYRAAKGTDHFPVAIRGGARPEPDGQVARRVFRALRFGDQPACQRHGRRGIYRVLRQRLQRRRKVRSRVDVLLQRSLGQLGRYGAGAVGRRR